MEVFVILKSSKAVSACLSSWEGWLKEPPKTTVFLRNHIFRAITVKISTSSLAHLSMTTKKIWEKHPLPLCLFYRFKTLAPHTSLVTGQFQTQCSTVSSSFKQTRHNWFSHTPLRKGSFLWATNYGMLSKQTSSLQGEH